VIDDLTVNENHLSSLNAAIVVEPASGEPNWIERDLIAEVVHRALGLNLPKVLLARLPERLEYAQLGARLEVHDEVLYVFGTHGPGEKTILTVSVAGQELPVVYEPEKPIDLRPALDGLRARLVGHIAERLGAFSAAEAWRALARPQPSSATTRRAGPE
jgi:hypothetical protein